MMHEGWMLKKSIADNVSSGDIDRWYSRGLEAGALGGKLLGAGGGGFLVFYAPPEKHKAIRDALGDIQPVAFHLDREGSQIIFQDDTNPARFR
jgi:D-glycero-alpha-D-manno-heptose-7-phosphate kinase